MNNNNFTLNTVLVTLPYLLSNQIDYCIAAAIMIKSLKLMLH